VNSPKGRLSILKNSKQAGRSHRGLEGSRARRQRDKRHGRNGARRRIVVAALLLAACAVVAVATADYWANYGKIYPGVSIGSVSLGGKTPEEAQSIVEEYASSIDEIELTGPQEFTLSSSQLGVDYDVRSSVDRAYAIGRQGNVFERVSDKIEATWGTVPIPLAVDYDRERLRDGLSGVFLALTVEAVEAGFEVNGNRVSVTESRTGQEVDEEKLLDDIEAGLPEGQRKYDLSVATDEPDLTTAEAESLKPTTLLGTYRTDYRETSDKSPERVENLRIASNAIDGALLAPGEVFSLTELVAPLSYNETKVIIEGKEEKADGGGLCQVSSTLYMAANYAGLEIIERHPHAAQLPYIRPGFDATVWFGDSQSQPLDMKFKNDTNGYLLLREYVSDDGYIYAEFWGRPTGEEVEMNSEPEYVGPDYSKWITYKKVKENGKVVFDDVFHKDVYEPLVDEKGKIIRPDSEEAKPAPVNP
jgi:vancomycin resistance protein YoaR